MYLSEILSSFICGKPDFDPQVRYLAKRSIVDTMGAMLAGSCTDVVKQLLPVYNAPGCCTLVGLKGAVSANNAAFLNGISGHELELDDTSSSNLGHPTVAVLPSVLAAGEERAASGEEVLKAFILATEVECKIGRICAAELHRRGWHASSITGVLGAAAGTGYLYGQDRDTMRNTLGIAASMASGVRENFGTSTKSVHIGKTAGDGVLAAQMASHGITSSPSALEGHEGYLREYAGFDGVTFGDDFARTLGAPYDLCSPGFAIKLYPSCSSTHRAIDALTELIRENELKPADIAKIEIGLSQSALRELVTPYPRDGEEAKFSIGFQIALYLNGLDNMPVNYREDVIRQPEIARIIQLTSMYNEPKYDNLPTDMGVGPAFGRITTVDGRVLTRERVYPDGHLTHPIPDQGIHDKYMKSALPVLGQEKAEELYRRLMALEEERDIRALLALCR